jgi:hypothetical protein
MPALHAWPDVVGPAPPRSLLTSDHVTDPWWLLVASTLRTGPGAFAVLAALCRAAPDPDALLDLPLPQLRGILRPLGLASGRAARLRRLAKAYAHAAPTLRSGARAETGGVHRRVVDLDGAGLLANEAWRLFVEGDLSTRPADRELGEWWEWATSHAAMRDAAAVPPVEWAPRKRVRRRAKRATGDTEPSPPVVVRRGGAL